MNFEFRNCTFNDLDFIVNLKDLGMKWYIEKLYGWNYEIQKQKTFEELNEHLTQTKIITVNKKDIGVTVFIENKNYFEIGLIVVHPDFQNNGIASKIIKEYINIAKQNKKRIIIKTFKENPAQNLYLRLGFKIFKTDKTHLYMEINF